MDDASGLREYALALWSKKLIVIVITLVFIGGCLGYCAITKAKYTATTQLQLEPQISPALLDATTNAGGAITVDVPTSVAVIESRSVQNAVRRTYPNAPSVSAVEQGTTAVVNVSVSSENASQAATYANAYANAYINQVQQQTANTFAKGEKLLQKRLGTLQIALSNVDTQIKDAPAGSNLAGLDAQVSTLQNQEETLQNQLANYEFFATQGNGDSVGRIVSDATVPTKPSSPKTVEWTLIAAILGILVGIGIALIVNAVTRT
jgi:uncharacterized protein involved in exopolysaccharide biosynthesis